MLTENDVKLMIKEELELHQEKQDTKMEGVYERLTKMETSLSFIKGKFEGFGGNLTGRQKTIVGGLSVATLMEFIAIMFQNIGGG